MAETVKVRVAVAMNTDGEWYAVGSTEWTEATTRGFAAEGVIGDTIQIYWLTADLPLPTEPEVAASVEGEGRE